jgi:SAM-dependent methyltransferase
MDFDRFAETYESDVETATRFAGLPPDFFLEVKVDHILTTLRQAFGDLSRVRVLDVGCGVGLTDQRLETHLPCLAGVDVSAKCLEVARARNPRIAYHHAADDALPFASGSFDVAFAICVWHHVPPGKWANFLSELSRVIARKGLLLVYEHNPWNPLTRLVVSRCSFDKDAVLLSARQAARRVGQFGFGKIFTDYLIFVPSRNRLIRRWETAIIRKIPLGAQYALCAARL